MFILLPTFDASARLSEIALDLLERHWPGHPMIHVLHHSRAPERHAAKRTQLHDRGPDGSRWLGNLAEFLMSRSEELFLLLLDDYALCGSAKVNVIAHAVELIQHNLAIGLFPLCWYPAAGRERRAGWDGIETLSGTPILLQAAIWRRSWFLELARGMDERTSPWGFEALATRKAKSIPREICAAQMPTPAYVGGHLIDGFDKSDWPLPYHNLMHRGEQELKHEAFLRSQGFAFPSRGLGDSVARLAQATGAAQVVNLVKQATGQDCGCQKRRAALNRAVPYRTMQMRKS